MPIPGSKTLAEVQLKAQMAKPMVVKSTPNTETNTALATPEAFDALTNGAGVRFGFTDGHSSKRKGRRKEKLPGETCNMSKKTPTTTNNVKREKPTPRSHGGREGARGRVGSSELFKG